MKNNLTESEDFIREYFKNFPSFYYFITDFFGPLFLVGLTPKTFLIKYNNGGKILNIGSGPRKIDFDGNIFNIDIGKYHGVDIVGDIENVPTANSSFSAVVCDNLLEHVKNEEKAIFEIDRVLLNYGVAYICAPFIYPYHSSPSDFTRWTKQGLETKFSNFEIVEIGVRAGAFSTLNVLLCYLFAMVFSFGNSKLYIILTNLSLFLFFPIKFLDIIFNYWPNSINMAAILYCVVRKNTERKFKSTSI